MTPPLDTWVRVGLATGAIVTSLAAVVGARACWRAWRLARRYVVADSLITGATPSFTGHDESLHQQAQARRARVASIHRAAARLASGSVATTPAEVVSLRTRG